MKKYKKGGGTNVDGKMSHPSYAKHKRTIALLDLA